MTNIDAKHCVSHGNVMFALVDMQRFMHVVRFLYVCLTKIYHIVVLNGLPAQQREFDLIFITIS